VTNGIFVTGTDTGVGKTVICALLVRYLRQRGLNAVTQKWVETGARGKSNEIRLHRRLLGSDVPPYSDISGDVSPYLLDFPSSPHLAAGLQRRRISASRIKAGFKRLSMRFDFVAVEGTGGLLVPFNRKGLIVDIAGELGLPVLIVAGNRLGAINHTLLTLEALKTRGLIIKGVIFNNTRPMNPLIANDNPSIVKAQSGADVMGPLPYRRNAESLYGHFIPFARRLFGAKDGGEDEREDRR